MSDAVKSQIVAEFAASGPDTLTKATLRHAREQHAARVADGDPHIHLARDGAMRCAAFVAGAKWAREHPDIEVPS